MDIPTGVICRRLNPGELEHMGGPNTRRGYLQAAQYVVIRPTVTGDRVRTFHVSWLSALWTANRPVRQP
jgi:hypothetical protein